MGNSETKKEANVSRPLVSGDHVHVTVQVYFAADDAVT